MAQTTTTDVTTTKFDIIALHLKSMQKETLFRILNHILRMYH